MVPHDALTDSQDVCDNVIGDGTLPQDKAHRTYILALREEVRKQGIRLWTKYPTDCMLADGLTKPMKSPQLERLLQFGVYEIGPQASSIPGKPVKEVRFRRFQPDESRDPAVSCGYFRDHFKFSKMLSPKLKRLMRYGPLRGCLVRYYPLEVTSSWTRGLDDE